MKINILHKSFFITCAVMLASFRFAQAATINSSYVGPDQGLWSNPSNWSPAIVPNNSGTQTFNVSTADLTINYDVDATLSSLTFMGDFPTLISVDHNLTSANTSVAGNATDGFSGGSLIFVAQHQNVVANLGNLADFSGTTLNTGYLYAVDTAGDFAPVNSDPGLTATMQFNGANIEINHAGISLTGPRTRIVDEYGADALRNFRENKVDGFFGMADGRGNFTTGGSFTNEGELHTGDGSSMTVNGDYTGIGFPLDPGTVGLTVLETSGDIGDASMVIKGQLTNYNAAAKTLNKTYYEWIAAKGHSATVQVLGVKSFDIVTSNASLLLFGPNTGFRDKKGNDALRNLATSARLQIGNRDFTTIGSFVSTGRLTVFGGATFTVNGHLTINGGFFELSPLNGYLAGGGNESYPIDPPYISSSVAVKGNFNLPSPSSLLVRLADAQAKSTMAVGGAAVFAGSLDVRLFFDSNVSSSDGFTVLTAQSISGQFSNVKSGGRVSVTSGGATVGTMRVTYSGTSLVLSDFRASHPH